MFAVASRLVAAPRRAAGLLAGAAIVAAVAGMAGAGCSESATTADPPYDAAASDGAPSGAGGASGFGGQTAAGAGGLTSSGFGGFASPGAGGAVASGVGGSSGRGGASATGGRLGQGGVSSGVGGSSASGAGGRAVSSGTGGQQSSDAGVCQMVPCTWAPRIPTVLLLVDRSRSMFGCRSGGPADQQGCINHADTTWYPLRDGVLPVISAKQATVRFGFAAFTGETNACPAMTTVAPEANGYADIAAAWNALSAPASGQTPTRKALDQAGAALLADASPGDRFIMLFTDGAPDYCDDATSICPSDSVVGGLQTLYSLRKITTLVFGLASPLGTATTPMLQAFANAGVGQPVLPPLDAGLTVGAYYNQCAGAAQWMSDFSATSKTLAPGQSIGDYSAASGNATLYRPDPTANTQALTTQLGSALGSLKSCLFDLKANDGTTKLKANLDLLSLAHVRIDGVEIPLNTGWQMDAVDKLELIGNGCATWRKPESMAIEIMFPCGGITPQ